MSKIPAVLDTFMKFSIVNSIEIHRKIISISPARGDRRPKNAADQSTLSTSWTAKMTRAVFTSFSSRPLRQTRYAEIPIMTKRVVHTGKNTQLGGAKDGLMSVAYHVGIAGVVKNEPRKPAKRQMVMLTIILIDSETFLFIM